MAKNLLIILGSICVAVALLAGSFVAYVTWANGTDKEAVAKLVRAADMFEPDSSWTLDSENIQPKRSCFEYKCPVVFRAWKSSENLDIDKMHSLAIVGDSRLALSDSCFAEGSALCIAEGDVEGYEYLLSSDYDVNNYVIRLSVTKK